jgi:hypothetical protein
MKIGTAEDLFRGSLSEPKGNKSMRGSLYTERPGEKLVFEERNLKKVCLCFLVVPHVAAFLPKSLHIKSQTLIGHPFDHHVEVFFSDIERDAREQTTSQFSSISAPPSAIDLEQLDL